MRCAECDCVSDAAGGWIAVLGRDPEDDDALRRSSRSARCAPRAFRMAAKTAETYT
jgi:hypothetical protein